MLNYIMNKNILLNIILIFISLSLSLCQHLGALGIGEKDKILKFTEQFVLETEIDPTKYILGPGDKVGLSIIATSNLSYVLTITPTGNLWIPDFGQIYISGMDIESAEHKIGEYISSNRYKTAKVILALLNIRQFKNQVIGAVINPGMITVTSLDRLTDIIRKSGGFNKLADENNIIISRTNGNKIKTSLKSFHFDGDLINNPILKEGDIIYVPYREDLFVNIESTISHKRNLIYVMGFVLKPAGHKYIPGYNISDYIAMSGGINDMGSKKNIIVNRNGIDIPFNSVNAIEPGDQIYVSANMKYRLLGNMSILQTLTAMMTLFLTYQAAIN